MSDTRLVFCMRLALRPSAWVLALWWTLAGWAAAQTPPAAPTLHGDLVRQVQHWLDDQLVARNAMPTLRMTAEVGTLDARLKLASCQRMEPYLPHGTRLWGRLRVGVRCTQGVSPWNIFVPVTVHAFGPAWVIKGDVLPGQILLAGDALMAEVDWAEAASPIVASAPQWVGQTANRRLLTGQALRQDMLRATPAFAAGAVVRVVASGAGFQVVASGQAVTGGMVGQSVRVRMDNGQVVQGVVADPHTVQVWL